MLLAPLKRYDNRNGKEPNIGIVFRFYETSYKRYFLCSREIICERFNARGKHSSYLTVGPLTRQRLCQTDYQEQRHSGPKLGIKAANLLDKLGEP